MSEFEKLHNWMINTMYKCWEESKTAEPLKDSEYKCANCGDINEKAWSDEEAEQEAEELFGVKNSMADTSMAVVCDDCFNKLRGIHNF